MTPEKQGADNPRTIMFTLQQRNRYTEFLAAVEETQRKVGP